MTPEASGHFLIRVCGATCAVTNTEWHKRFQRWTSHTAGTAIWPPIEDRVCGWNHKQPEDDGRDLDVMPPLKLSLGKCLR